MTNSGSFEQLAAPGQVPAKSWPEAFQNVSAQWAGVASGALDSFFKRGGMFAFTVFVIYKGLSFFCTEDQRHRIIDKYLLFDGLTGSPLSIYLAILAVVIIGALVSQYRQNKIIKKRYRQRIRELTVMLRASQRKAGLLPIVTPLPMGDEP